MSQITRQISRADAADPLEAAVESPVRPFEPFVRTGLSAPDPGRLRPVVAHVGDTFRFIVGNLGSTIMAALPAVAAWTIMWPVYRWAYQPVFEDTVSGDLGLRVALAGSVGLAAGASGAYLFTTALANLVVRSERGAPMAPGAALRRAARLLPRVITANLLYALIVVTVLGLPVYFLATRFLLEREMPALTSWVVFAAGVLAYAAPQISVYFTAVKVDRRRPKFRRARQLVRGQRAAVLGRVLLWQAVRAANTALWAMFVFRVGTFGWFCFSIGTVVATNAVLTTAFTLMYTDLASVRAEDATPDDGSTIRGPQAEHGTAGRSRPTRRSRH